MRIDRRFDNMKLLQRMLKEMDELLTRKSEDEKDEKGKTKKSSQRDQVSLSNVQDPAEIVLRRFRSDGSQEQIRLSDLIQKLKTLNDNPYPQVSQAEDVPSGVGNTLNPTTVEDQDETVGQQNIMVLERSQIDVKIEIGLPERVEGLVLRNARTAETDRYRLDFLSGSDFKITDKWSKKSTTVWGDPHVDTSDEAGANNGDFKDLTGSATHTTFMLEDGTQVTFTAQDAGIIEEVNIIKGDQRLHGVGAGSREWGQERMLFDAEVTSGVLMASGVPTGDVVYAGGDGNDWYDASGKLVWGKTTAATPTPPSAWIKMEINQSLEQAIITSSVIRQA